MPWAILATLAGVIFFALRGAAKDVVGPVAGPPAAPGVPVGAQAGPATSVQQNAVLGPPAGDPSPPTAKPPLMTPPSVVAIASALTSPVTKVVASSTPVLAAPSVPGGKSSPFNEPTFMNYPAVVAPVKAPTNAYPPPVPPAIAPVVAVAPKAVAAPKLVAGFLAPNTYPSPPALVFPTALAKDPLVVQLRPTGTRVEPASPPPGMVSTVQVVKGASSFGSTVAPAPPVPAPPVAVSKILKGALSF